MSHTDYNNVLIIIYLQWLLRFYSFKLTELFWRTEIYLIYWSLIFVDLLYVHA